MKRKTPKCFGNRGFTLIELIIVIAIMAILVGVLAPNFLRYLQQARVARDTQLMNALRTAMQTAMVDPTVPAEELDWMKHANNALYPDGNNDQPDGASTYWQIVAENLGYSDPTAMAQGLCHEISAKAPEDCLIRYRVSTNGDWQIETAIIVMDTREYYAKVPADGEW